MGPHLKFIWNTIPLAFHTPAHVPIHWQKQVEGDLIKDEKLGVLESVPFGEPVIWCHGMFVTKKQGRLPRRTVDLSPLNSIARERHVLQKLRLSWHKDSKRNIQDCNRCLEPV